nr:hypothetical protein [uncultured Caproiciproducens sp.]
MTSTELTPLKTEIERLQEFLQATVGHFRIGEDAAGMENYLSTMQELERTVETDRNSRQPRIDLNKLLPVVRKLYFFVKNQDITGITDLLEYTVFPLTKEWLKGCDDT